ncbi:MAG: Ig-like domain-containing protein [Gemmatimonadetes bacterium]|nr:Ig-like domain-containing protein [Gemmatimonadota bacterium]
MSQLDRPLVRVLLGAVVLGLSACQEPITEPIGVAEIVVNGGSGNLRPGQSVQLSTTLKSTEGLLHPPTGLTWSTSDPSIATVSPAGQVTALRRGYATISASAFGVTGTSTATVIGVQSVASIPDSVSVIVTQSVQLTASVIADSAVTVAVSWSSLDTLLATVSSTGRVTAKASPGTARIVVSAEDKRDTTVVSVVPVPVRRIQLHADSVWIFPEQSLGVTAQVLDSLGGVLAGRAVVWSVSDTGIARVSSTGMVTAITAGRTTLVASSEGVEGRIPVIVRTLPRRIVVNPDSTVLRVGSAQLFTATALDDSNQPMSGVPYIWKSSDTLVARVFPSGVVNARHLGQATVTASLGAVVGTALVRVTPVPVATIAITGANTVVVNETVPLAATLQDSSGTALIGRTITWTSADSTILTINQAGLVTGRQPGSSIVTATSEGVSSTLRVLVTSQPSGMALTLTGPANTGGFYVRVSGGGLLSPGQVEQSFWTYVPSPTGTGTAFLELPPSPSVPYSVRAISIDARSITSSGGRLVANGITGVASTLGVGEQRQLVMDVPAVHVTMVQAPTSAGVFASTRFVWEIKDPSRSLLEMAHIDAGLLICSAPLSSTGTSGQGGCDTARNTTPFINSTTGVYQWVLDLPGRVSSTVYWTTLLVWHPTTINGGRQFGFFAPNVLNGDTQGRLVIGTGG